MPDKQPAPVHIVGTDDPVPVEIIATSPAPPPKTVDRAANLVATPTTTAEQDLVTRGQRRINFIWEFTQAIIAIAITSSVIYAALIGKESTILSNAFTLIIAVYFVRVNHVKTGGVGGTDSR